MHAVCETAQAKTDGYLSCLMDGIRRERVKLIMSLLFGHVSNGEADPNDWGCECYIFLSFLLNFDSLAVMSNYIKFGWIFISRNISDG